MRIQLLPCANAEFHSFNHTPGDADFKSSVLGCLTPTATHPLDPCPCMPHTPAAPLHHGAFQPHRIPRSRGCRAARAPLHTQNHSPTAERLQSNPSEEVPHLPVASRNTQAHTCTPNTCIPPIPLPFGTRHRGWSPRRQWRQRAGCLQGNNPALSPVTFGFGTWVSMRCLGKVTAEGGRQEPAVFFQPDWSNGMAVTPQSSVLALRETGHRERQHSPMEG